MSQSFSPNFFFCPSFCIYLTLCLGPTSVTPNSGSSSSSASGSNISSSNITKNRTLSASVGPSGVPIGSNGGSYPIIHSSSTPVVPIVGLDTFHTSHTSPMTPLFNPAHFQSPNQPSHMFIPHTRPPLDPNIPQDQQYYLSLQQQSFQPQGQLYTPHYPTTQDHTLQLTQPTTIPNNVHYMAPNPINIPDHSSILKSCLHHFSTYEKLKLTVLLPGEKFLQLVTDNVPLYEPLANAVGSLAARNLSQQQLVYVQAAVDFKIRALNLLRQDLVYQGVSESSLLCMLILGNVEMNDHNIDAWSQHLDGAAKAASEILARNNVFQNPSNYSNFMLILDCLTYQDIVSGLALCKRPRLRDVYLRNINLFSQTREDQTSNYYQAISSVILGVCETLCLAADLQEAFPSTLHKLGFKNPSYYCVDKSYYSPDHYRRYNEIFSAVSTLPSVAGLSPEIALLMHTSKNAMLLYFMLRLDPEEFLYKLSPRVEKLRDEGLNGLLEGQSTKVVAVQQSINIWIIGLVCESAEDRNALLNKIKEFYAEVPRPSLYSVMNYLSSVWKMRDSPEMKEYPLRDILSLVTEQTAFTILP